MMPSTASRDDWALALARFAGCLRTDWDVPGIRAAIHQAKRLGSREDIAIALVELTRRTDLRTPALLADDGPWWHTGRTPNVRVRETRCDVYGHEYERLPCKACVVDGQIAAAEEVNQPDPLAWTPRQAQLNADGARTARAALTRKV